ncbi:MAG: hypothetical protein AB2813_12310 [Candidatus Sedimenticola endophacoides]
MSGGDRNWRLATLATSALLHGALLWSLYDQTLLEARAEPEQPAPRPWCA